jgi:hypothetical protein
MEMNNAEFDLWKELAADAVHYVSVRRNGLYKDEPKAFQDLEESVNMFLSETYDGEG